MTRLVNLLFLFLLLQLQHFGMSLHIPILYETDKLLVIDKVAGIAHHDKDNAPLLQQEQKGILSLLRDEYPHLPPQLYSVHRLDQVTSGLLVVAKTTSMARCLTQAFTDRRVVKYYTGLSLKVPKKKKQGWINGYMQRGRRKSWYLTRPQQEQTQANDDDANDSDGDNATTSVWAKTYFWTAGLGHLDQYYQGPTEQNLTGSGNLDSTTNVSPRTLMLFRPYTGRTHQLRVASKSLGLPLLGDPLYTTTTGMTASSTQEKVSYFPRTCLHATALHIPAECLEEAGMREDLTMWSTPPFFEWWQKEHRPDVWRLLKKDASVPTGLLEAAVRY